MTTSEDHRARRALSMLDLTSLGDDDSAETVTELCHATSTPHGPVAAVCVWPRFVALAHELLEGVAVRIAAVDNFPLGENDPAAAAEQAAAIVGYGGHEVDVVFPWRAHMEGDERAGEELVAAV
ncbi:MAG: deoxyribose-phosphate aldolase, partial [Actinomycetota bacterium]|nr:deoxyribose-phosphate aldolase [Actinomycetota bacterium]